MALQRAWQFLLLAATVVMAVDDDDDDDEAEETEAWGRGDVEEEKGRG